MNEITRIPKMSYEKLAEKYREGKRMAEAAAGEALALAVSEGNRPAEKLARFALHAEVIAHGKVSAKLEKMGDSKEIPADFVAAYGDK